MKKIIFLLFLLQEIYSQSIDNIVVTPDTFTVGTQVQISIQTTGIPGGQRLFLYVGADLNSNVIIPNYADLDQFGNYSGSHKIYRAGCDSVRVNWGATIAWSNLFCASIDTSLKRLQILLPGQAQWAGDSINQGRQRPYSFSLTAGQSENFTVYITDKYWNPLTVSVSGVSVSTWENYATFIPETDFSFSGDTTVQGTFRTSTQPQQTVNHPPYQRVRVFSSDTTILPDTSDSFEVLSGNYTKLLLMGPGESPNPGEYTTGKTGTIPLLASGVSFYTRVWACDNYFNRISGVNDSVSLRFISGDTSFVTITPKKGYLASGRDSFSLNITSSGVYTLYAIDIPLSIESKPITLDIRGNQYRDSLIPDTCLSNRDEPIYLEYLDFIGNRALSTHYAYLRALNCADKSPASGVLVPTKILIEQGVFNGEFNYTITSGKSEDIVLEVWDSIGGYPHQTKCIHIVYLPEIIDTLVNYPNPFGSEGMNYTDIVFYLPKNANVKLSIYDLFGNPVWKYTGNGVYGKNTVRWYGRNDRGLRVASGTYIAILKATSGAQEILSVKRLIGVVW